MKKMVGAVLMAALLAVPTLAAAEPWAVVASQFYPSTGSTLDDREGLFTVDLDTVPPKVYGPFLQGVFTQKAGPGVFDVAMLPNGREALVSNFGDSKVLRIDLSDPTNPRLTGALRTQWNTGVIDPDTGKPIIYSFFAEDIAVSRDGSFAIVTDGGFSPYLAFIDLATFKVKKIQKTVFPNPRFPDDRSKDRTYSAQSVAITPDGRTVLFVDYFSGAVNWGLVNATKDGLTSVHSILLCSKLDAADPKQCDGTFARPVNVTIAPDGETALVANASADRPDSGGSRIPVERRRRRAQDRPRHRRGEQGDALLPRRPAGARRAHPGSALHHRREPEHRHRPQRPGVRHHPADRARWMTPARTTPPYKSAAATSSPSFRSPAPARPPCTRRSARRSRAAAPRSSSASTTWRSTAAGAGCWPRTPPCRAGPASSPRWTC